MSIYVYVCFINVLWLIAMNTDAARKPVENSNWESLDIFLFSNGQQYSPPRKYHLRAEDLNWWSLTLNYLARSQYGSLHSNIQLFTTNGRRISAPTELQNGAAYVAVKLPDSFIDTGSWERRHTSLLDNINTEKPSTTNTIDETIACPTNYQPVSNGKDNNIKKLDSILKKETVKSNVGQSDPGSINTDDNKLPRRTSILKRTNRNSVNSPVLPKKNVDKRIASKWQDNKANSKTNTLKSSLPHKISIISVEQENKDEHNTSLILSKDLPVIQDNGKVNNDESILVVTENDIKIESIKDLKEKTLDEDQANIEEYDTIIISKEDSISSKISETVIKMEGKQAEPVRQLICEIVSDAVNVPNNGHPFLNNNIKPIKDSKVTIVQESNESDETQTIFDVHQKNIEDDDFSQKININPKDKTTEDDEITIVSNGNVLNLRLNIEMKNDEEEEFTIVHKTHLNVKKDKSDKISQVNIDYSYDKEVDGINKKIYVTSKAIQFGREWDDVNQDYRNTDHINIFKQCSCIDDPNIKKILTRNNKKYSIFITPVNHTCDFNGCNGRNERYSIVQPPGKTISQMSILITKKNKDDNIGSRGPSSVLNIPENRSNEAVRPHIQLKDEQDIKLNSSFKNCSIVSNELKKSDIPIVRKNKKQSLITSVDKYTQTEWCDIMLEARLCDDGHYTLHLPPLRVLKSYDI